MRTFARRFVFSIGGAVVALLIASWVTAHPGDTSLYPAAAGAKTVEIFVVSHGYHSGIAIPRAAMLEVATRDTLPALIALSARFAPYDWIEIGWGRRNSIATSRRRDLFPLRSPCALCSIRKSIGVACGWAAALAACDIPKFRGRAGGIE